MWSNAGFAAANDSSTSAVQRGYGPRLGSQGSQLSALVEQVGLDGDVPQGNSRSALASGPDKAEKTYVYAIYRHIR